MTTFFTAQHHSAKAASTDPSFTVTYGDTYTFTDNTPTSSSGSQVDLGNWTVTDTTTNTNLGTLSGTINASQSGNNVTGQTAISAPQPLGSLNNSFTSFPTDADYTQNTDYQNEVSKHGGYVINTPSETVMGDEEVDMSCSDDPNCDVFAVDPQQAVQLGGSNYNNPAVTALQDGIKDENSGYSTLQGVSASTIPSQLLARQFGGGPLAMHRPLIAPLAIFAIGIAIGLGGLVLSNICNFRNASNPCSGNEKGALAIIGGILTLVGGALAGWSGAIYAGAQTAAASAGQVAAGFEMTQTAIGESTALLSSQLETLQSALGPLASAGGNGGIAIAAA
jgi:hypothetical protein